MPANFFLQPFIHIFAFMIPQSQEMTNDIVPGALLQASKMVNNKGDENEFIL
jgi:hypothetical protein